MNIVIACGGTGGHIYPGITLAQTLQAQNPTDILFIGSSLRMEKDLIPAAGFAFAGLPIAPLQKQKPLKSLRNLWHCTQQAQQLLRQHQTAAVVGLGSYITVPTLLAAARLKLPVFLVETNIVPGKANQWLARLAQWVALAHAESAASFGKTPTHVTGSPVRPEFGSYSREEGAKLFELDPTAPVVSIIGGSQGALRINQAVTADLDALLAIPKLQIVHVCGASNYDQIRQTSPLSAGQPRYRLLKYVDNMPALLACTDLAVSRAGASMIAELMVCHVPAILIPGSFGGGHQRDNALAVTRAGAGLLLEEKDLTPGSLSAQIQDVIGNRERLNTMRHHCAQLNPSNAAEQIVSLIRKTLNSTQEALPC